MTTYGFTGSQTGVTGKQIAWLGRQLEMATVLHHGACIGADAAAHDLGLMLEISMVVHPPTNQSKVYAPALIESDLVKVLEPYPYLERNRHIVGACEELLALPDGPQRLRSGTWSTIRFAKRLQIPISICMPDGTVVPG